MHWLLPMRKEIWKPTAFSMSDTFTPSVDIKKIKALKWVWGSVHTNEGPLLEMFSDYSEQQFLQGSYACTIG